MKKKRKYLIGIYFCLLHVGVIKFEHVGLNRIYYSFCLFLLFENVTSRIFKFVYVTAIIFLSDSSINIMEILQYI